MQYVVIGLNKRLIREKIRNLDSKFAHPSYYLETRILCEIREGLLNEAKGTLNKINAFERTSLAFDSIRSLKNSLIGSCTLFARATIDAGVHPEDAFSLSDVFIKNIEKLSNESELNMFEYQMLEEFILLVKQNAVKHFAYPISKVVNYINENTTLKLTVPILAQVAHLSPDHLSRTFYEEVGIHLTDYIQRRKIEVAKIFLEYSDMKVADIATMLEFCNAAYFTSVFKKYMGVSATQFRKISG